MKRLTEKRSNTIKAFYGIMVGIVYQLAFQLPSNLALQISLTLICAFLYTIPCIINLETIKHFEIKGIKPFIKSDILFLLPEAVISSVMTELICQSFQGVNAVLSGMGSIIFILIVIPLTAVFWLAYLIFNSSYK